MKKNKPIIIATLILVILGVSFFYLRQNKNSNNSKNKEPIIGDNVLSLTFDYSKEYAELRSRTDKTLAEAKDFNSYESWDTEMTGIIHAWQQMNEHAQFLEKVADKNSGDISFYENIKFINSANAYSAEEISNIFDKAPAGKKIKTLAKFLGVDAKRAFKILKTDQEFVKADAWKEAGDTFKKLETSAVVIKDGCKVAGFIGGVVLSGGTAGIAGASSLTQMSVFVGGADLILEVGEDSAIISLGDNNKYSSFFGDARKITSPAASILGLANIPGNLESGFDKFNAIMFGADQIRGLAQEGSLLGINISSDGKIVTSALDKKDLTGWFKDQKKDNWTEEDEKALKELMGDFGDEEASEEKKSETPKVNENKNTSEEIKMENPQEENKADDEFSAKKAYGKNGKTYVSVTAPNERSLMVGSAMPLTAEIGDYIRADDEDYECYWTWYVNGEKMGKWEDVKSCNSTRVIPYNWETGVLKVKVRVEFGKTNYEPVGDYAPGEEITDYKKTTDIRETITAERSYKLLPMPVDTYQYGQ